MVFTSPGNIDILLQKSQAVQTCFYGAVIGVTALKEKEKRIFYVNIVK